MSDNIRVAIRVRPVISRERNESIVWKVRDSKYVQSGSEKFCFDKVFDTDKTNEDVYYDICQPIVKSIIQGFNGTIFAYGQTSSGKTYTMFGEHGGIKKGVIHYAIDEIFGMIQEMPDREFLLRVSFIQIYNEKVYDMLSDKKDEDLKLQDDYSGVLNVKGLQEKIVPKPDMIWEYMCQAQNRRHTRKTDMNVCSSRSHFIFRMIVESRIKGEEDSVVNVSQLNIVDLAGSENASLKSAKEIQFKEGVHINSSLLTLSKVINKLSVKTDQFINYRESKLTRILQNSLGGNAVTAIICAITPVSLSFNQSLSTLNFASRAKQIKNKPEKNEIFNDQTLLKYYANQITKLSQQLEASKERGKELEKKNKDYDALINKITYCKNLFVTQTPNFKQKASRRETWGGSLDSRLFPKPKTSYMLPQIVEEESERDIEPSDVFSESLSRQRKSRSSSISLSSTRNSLSKKVQDNETQTDLEDLKQNAGIDEAMTLVTDLKLQLTTLQNEFAQLTEYTTYEKQILKAENELQVEIKTLKEENNALRKALESNSLSEKPHSPVPCDLKEKETDLSRNEISGCVDNKFNDEALSNQLTNLVNSDSCQLLKDTSNINITSSTVFEESLNSNFMTLYDECIESEALSQLKSEIESLKYNIEIKDKQLTLLNDKILIKDQFITSLKDEIALGKNIDSPNKSDKSMSQKIVQMHEICQTDFTSHDPEKYLYEKECQTSPVKSSEVVSVNCSKLNITGDLNASPLKHNQLTQVTPIKLKEFSIQCSRKEVTAENYAQTSPIKQSNSVFEHSKGENSEMNQFTQVTDSFLEECNQNFAVCDKENNLNALFDQSTQTVEIFPDAISQEVNLAVDEISTNDFSKSLHEVDNFSNEMIILVNKIGELKSYIHNFMKNSAQAKYFKPTDVFESDADDNSSHTKLVHKELADLETLVISLESYMKYADEDCEILNSQLESRNKEVILLGLKVSDTESALNAKESELSNLCEMFFDLKQKFSQLNSICQVLKYIDSEDAFIELKKSANVPMSPQSCIPEYEMTQFKKLFERLNLYMEENASKIISLSEDLKKVKLELSAVQQEKDSQLYGAGHVLKSTISKSIQTSEILDSSDAVKTDNAMIEFKNEINRLQEVNSDLEQSNKDLRQELSDLISSHSERIESLEGYFETAKSDWNAKTVALVKDLEEKYDQELIDQENKLSEEFHAKVAELKQGHSNHHLKEEIAEMVALHDKEIADIKKHYEDQLLAEHSEKLDLKNQLEKEKEQEILALKTKHNNRQMRCREVLSQQQARMQHYSEEIEKLKRNTPSSHTKVIEELNDKVKEVSNERESLRQKLIETDQQMTELKGQFNHLKHKLKKMNEVEELKGNACSKEIEETNKKLLYDLDQKKAKIMSIEANNVSLLQEVKKLKEMLSSKNPSCSKCKKNPKDSKTDNPEICNDNKERKSRSNSKNDSDAVSENQASKQRSTDANITPKQNDHSNHKTIDENCHYCVGGGSGPANMVKNYWLEGVIHKKDKEISKLRAELTELRSQLKNRKDHPQINKEKQSEDDKPEITRVPMPPLKEVDENVTVQVKTLHPFHGEAVPEVQRKHILREKNGRTSKPYEKPQTTDHIKKENAPKDWQFPTSYYNVASPAIEKNRCKPNEKQLHASENNGPRDVQDTVKRLADPECKQQ